MSGIILSMNSWTVGRAQSALGEVAYQLLAAVDALRAIYDGLPPPPDLADRQEHRKPFDVATEVLATIECIVDDNLSPAIRDLQHAAQVTDEELEWEFFEQWEGEIPP